MNLQLRPSTPADLHFLREMLYEAIFWRPNPNKPSFEEALALPDISNDLADWGKREGDTAVIALVDSTPAGAAWYRFYTEENSIRGYIDEAIPVIVIAVHADYRHQGIGPKMMAWLIQQAAAQNIRELSLMVSKDNSAMKLYRKCGFAAYEDTGDSLLMLRKIE